jgi:hypothetical protein
MFVTTHTGHRYQGPALQQQPSARSLGEVDGYARGIAFATVRELLDELAWAEDDYRPESERLSGYIDGLRSARKERLAAEDGE